MYTVFVLCSHPETLGVGDENGSAHDPRHHSGSGGGSVSEGHGVWRAVGSSLRIYRVLARVFLPARQELIGPVTKPLRS